MNVVEKYGGSSVATLDKIKAIAAHVKQRVDNGDKVVVVASAMGKTTNKLIEMASEVGGLKNDREMDSLLSTGEQRTVTLLAMAIDALGVPAISLTGYQCGFITNDHHAHARIVDVDITNLQKHLDDGKVVVVAGFQGASKQGEITTLGRGGSDTTAVALAAKLGWECHIYTDVDGVYTCDPRLFPRAKRIEEITYQEMMEMACLGSGVLETRSVELASKYQVPLYLAKALETEMRGTRIVEKTKKLEDMPISGISVKDDYVIMQVHSLPQDGKYLGELFALIAKLDINLDTISQQLKKDGTVDFSFYCTKQQSDKILENVDQLSHEHEITRLLGYVKISVVGIGISTHSGIAAKVLNTLSANGICYYMITSSEISISLTIAQEDKERAIKCLGEVFDL